MSAVGMCVYVCARVCVREKSEEGECGFFFFFLNKNKPKGWLGFVVLTGFLAYPSPEENGCLKCLDHISRSAPGSCFPPTFFRTPLRSKHENAPAVSSSVAAR